jgi:hypothetical protein
MVNLVLEGGNSSKIVFNPYEVEVEITLVHFNVVLPVELLSTVILASSVSFINNGHCRISDGFYKFMNSELIF